MCGLSPNHLWLQLFWRWKMKMILILMVLWGDVLLFCWVSFSEFMLDKRRSYTGPLVSDLLVLCWDKDNSVVHYWVMKLNSQLFDCSGLLKKIKVVKANGGIRHFLYQLTRPSGAPTVAKAEGSNTLGKLEIMWRTTLGEPGRLQTQQILGNVSPRTRTLVNLSLILFSLVVLP